jgi:hypothetical protein
VPFRTKPYESQSQASALNFLFWAAGILKGPTEVPVYLYVMYSKCMLDCRTYQFCTFGMKPKSTRQAEFLSSEL